LHAHERARFARAVDVDRARHHLLAGAGLAAQQDRRRRLRHLLDAREHVAQRRRFADDGAEVELAVRVVRQHADVRRQLLGEAPVLAHQREALDRVRQHAAQLLRIPRLGDVAVDAPRLIASISTSTSVNAVTMMPTASGRISRAALSRSRPVIFGMRWSVTIDRDVLDARERQRLLAAAGEQQLEAAAEVEAERVQVVGLVVHHQHRKFRRDPAPGPWP
jgi:hypothetical protein